MIVDNLANSAHYYSLHPLFEKAFELIGQLDINNNADADAPALGKSLWKVSGNREEDRQEEIDPIEENLLKISFVETKLKPVEEAKLETHKKFIDIQIPITKAETFGWKSLSSLSQPKEGYDATHDIAFFNDKPSTFVTLMPGEFVIFSPEDGHAPLIGEGETKKIIIKVAVI